MQKLKTNLNRTIDATKEAEEFLTELFQNGEGFHTDDSSFDLNWSEINRIVSYSEKKQLDRLMDQVHEYLNDPAEFVLDNNLV